MSPRKRLRTHSPLLPRPRCYRSSGCRPRASTFYSTAAHLRSRSRLTAAPPTPRACSHPPADFSIRRHGCSTTSVSSARRRSLSTSSPARHSLRRGAPPARPPPPPPPLPPCPSRLAAVRAARARRGGGGARLVLCVSAEFFPECAG